MIFQKTLSIVIGLLLLTFNSFSQEEAPKCGADKIKIEEQRNKLKSNNIRQKIKYENTQTGDAMTLNKKRTEVISYDKQGRITEWAYYTNYTKVEAIYRYSYDSRGNISELTLFSDIGNVLEKTIYSYANNGFLSQENFFEAGNTFVSRSAYEMNDVSKTITEMEYSANNSPVAKRIYHYSGLTDGELIKREVYKQGDELYYTAEFVYNNSKIEREDFFTSTGNLAYQFVYTYDVNGNNTEKIKYSPTKVILQRFTTVYTKTGLERGVIEYDRKGRIVSSVQYEYVSY